MSQEDKGLLLKDLCARLPYGIKVKNVKNNFDINNFNHNAEEIKFLIEEYSIKPYLRPMSSITMKEDKEMGTIGYNMATGETFRTMEQIDYLNKHHFDYRGLIEKGLALKAPEGMYKTE